MLSTRNVRQTRGCRRGTLREEVLEKQLIDFLTKLNFTDAEYELLKGEVANECDRSGVEAQLQEKELHLKLDKSKERSSRLADDFMDGIFDNQTYTQKKEQLEVEERDINVQLLRLRNDPEAMREDVLTSLELANSAYLSYKTANDKEKHDLVRTLVSNFTIEGEKVLLEPNLPFSIVADRNNLESGGPLRGASRTLSALAKDLLLFCSSKPNSKDAADKPEAEPGKPNNYRFSSSHERADSDIKFFFEEYLK